MFWYKPDISPFLACRWWELVYFSEPNPETFPVTKEKLGRIVGVAENQGDLMTWLVLDLETTMVVTRSEVRTARNENNPNLRAEARIRSSGGESDLQQLFSGKYAFEGKFESKLRRSTFGIHAHAHARRIGRYVLP